MTQIRAFVGHSFTAEDETVVSAFLTYFEQMKGALPHFEWVHAKAAEPTELAAKVLKLVDGRNVFIGICTKKERVVADEKLHPSWLNHSRKTVIESSLEWKTSDWIIQEIGLAIGRNMTVVLLVEDGCRKPGGLQGDVEYIPFDRSAPERAFGRLLEMIRALSPLTHAGEVTSAGPATEKTGKEADAHSVHEDNTPGGTWDKDKYESVFFWKLVTRDTEGADKIDAAFAASGYATDEQTMVSWKANAELWRIQFGQNGSLSRLRKYQQQFPEDYELSATLASAFAALKMHSEAATQYVNAAALVPENRIERERLRGLSAVQFSKAGNSSKSQELLKDQREILKSGEEREELNYLLRVKEVVEESEDKYSEIEVLERIVQLQPDDWDSRFNLAYSYSQLEMGDMALYHYSQIPHQERTSVTWNNLGVSYQQHSLPGKAVNSYRTASSKGETLAMSNLAYKFMHAGFLKEANEELQRAMKIDDFHRNVGEAVSALKDIPSDEEKKLNTALKNVEPKRRFFQMLGEAAVFPDVELLPEIWVGPDCELSISIQDGELRAVGEFERTPNALSAAFSSGPRIVKVTYRGKTIGRRVIGTFTRKVEGEKPSAGLLSLVSSDDDIEFAMVIQPDEGIISVAERQSSPTPRFYVLRAKENPTRS